MANVRLNIFENIPVLGLNVNNSALSANAQIHAHVVELPGSISLNTIILNGSQLHTSQSVSIYFGLYSLNGSTLSLANSASGSFNSNANGPRWISLTAISTTQDITPGNWWFAVMTSSGGNNSFNLLVPRQNFALAINAYGGPFFRGIHSVTTGAIPASIATSDFLKEGGNGITAVDKLHPYIVISA